MAPVEDSFVPIFAEEARSRLDRLVRELIALEGDPENTELVVSIFRDAHTIKGGAAMVGLDSTNRVAHSMEDVLAQLRAGERTVSSSLTDTLLATVDSLRALIDGGEAGQEDEHVAREALTRLHSLIVDPTPTEEPSSAPLVAVLDSSTTPGTGRAVGGLDGSLLQIPTERIDQLIRLVGEAAAGHLRVGGYIAEHTGQDPSVVTEYRALSHILNELQDVTMRSRMVTLDGLAHSLQRSVRDVARSSGKEVVWEALGTDTELDRGILEQLMEPLLHLVRNAVDHGVEPPDQRAEQGKPRAGLIRMHAMQLGSEVVVAIIDDGRGIDVARIRAVAARQGMDISGLSDEEALYVIFRSGFSTAEFVTDVSGRGVGMDIVRTRLEAVRGRVEVRSQKGSGSEFRVAVPITLALLPCMVMRCGGMPLAVPLGSVVGVLPPSAGGEIHVNGRQVVMLDDAAVPVVSLASTLGLTSRDEGPAIVLSGLTRTHAFRVDELVGQRDVVVKGLHGLIPRVSVFSGAGIEPDGSILLALDTAGLIDRARMAQRSPAADMGSGAEPDGPTVERELRGSILVVDDALTVRELQRAILEGAGFSVRAASNGVEALQLLGQEMADLVLTDVEMPEMDGFTLTQRIRADVALWHVPIIILTSRATEVDRQRGLDLGADAYITKRGFDQKALLNAVAQLIGGRRS